ncbi:MAG: NAD(P)/FAD-dependent oxidoreductase [Ruminococcaceae bacterium]|nr:NAD(P)/FAD-dependent oxidoreductase [Oscillospiraceae bacterium]
MYDCIIIGGGITGCAAAYELSRYDLRILLLEKENDVACGTTRANSAIIHAGYDPIPGSNMARTNVRGCAMMPELCRRLNVPFKQVGSLVLAFNEEDLAHIRKLYDRGCENGVPGLKVLTREETLAIEPNIEDEVCGALYAPTAGIVSPWELALALAETAARNGVEFAFESPVTAIERSDACLTVTTPNATYETRTIINAAGLYADKIHALIGGTGFELHADKGAYFLLDKNQGKLARQVVFQCPSEKGKGVLVSPTVHGNLIVGPDAVPGNPPEDVSVQAESLAMIRAAACRSIRGIDFRENIRNFAGNRARGLSDFLIEASPVDARFINLAGIQSPGLSSAPAIAEEAAQLVAKAGVELTAKKTFIDTREKIVFKELSREQQAEVIANNPLYGRIVCRCETITEGEIVDAIHRPLPPHTVDGVKRRCGSGMGRCQGGFCGIRVHEILARELNVPMEAIVKDRPGSYIILGETKGGAV